MFPLQSAGACPKCPASEVERRILYECLGEVGCPKHEDLFSRACIERVCESKHEDILTHF